MALQPGPQCRLGGSLKGGTGGLSVAILYCPRGRHKSQPMYGTPWTKTRFVPFSDHEACSEALALCRSCFKYE
ncbi:hypothetical protein JG688_00012256 [Phytophthora aleatoria]|uniref:Uncharacterized protein n=1 Tax=Phytophthora aleatoria TaxID=2496075 RepID=A0A8J5M4R4_9STRA|nr:hypothetical protein JG688_00012256 [Phytophthora aleatoria]